MFKIYMFMITVMLSSWTIGAMEQEGDIAIHNGSGSDDNVPFKTFQHAEWVTSIAYRPNGSQLACGLYDGAIKLWDIDTEALERTFQGHNDSVRSLAYHPDGSRFASASSDGAVKIWKSRTGAIRWSCAHPTHVMSVAYNHDGSEYAYAADDVGIWDLNKNQGRTLDPGVYGVSVAYSPDGKTLASDSEKIVQIWNSGSGDPLEKFKDHEGAVNSIAYSPDGYYLASGAFDKTIRIWDLRARQNPLKVLHGHTDSVCSIAYSPDGKYLASASRDQTVKIWNPAENKTLVQTIKAHESAVWAVAYSPDGRYVASGSRDKTVKIWSLSNILSLRATPELQE